MSSGDEHQAARAEKTCAVLARLTPTLRANAATIAAIGRMVAPKVAPLLLDLDAVAVDADGQVDGDAIDAALTAFLAEHPELAS